MYVRALVRMDVCTPYVCFFICVLLIVFAVSFAVVLILIFSNLPACFAF